VITSSSSPKGNVGLKFIAVEVVTFQYGFQGKGKRQKPKAFIKKPNWLRLNFICLFYFQRLYHSIQIPNLKKKKGSRLKKKNSSNFYQKKHNSISSHIALTNMNIMPYILPQFQF
jgi:hypothetical protein